ncbi:MAG: hypothetical protein M3O92_00680 [Actinomycetota bacterium]|nr:hypothetical protein [Actinomycetota bacterium]
MAKDLKPTDVRDIEYSGEFKSNITSDGIEEINERAEESVSDYKPGFTRQEGVDEA